MKHILHFTMNKILIILSFITSMCCISSCCAIREVPIKTETITQVRDSVIMRDSVIISHVTKERIVDVVPVYDTLHLETDFAKAISYVDTTKHILRGQIENKPQTPIKTKIQWQDRIIEKEVIKEVEVPVEVEIEKKYIPTWCWYSLIGNVVVLMLLGFRLYRKFIL